MRLIRVIGFVLAFTMFGALTGHAGPLLPGSAGVSISVGDFKTSIFAEENGVLRLAEPIQIFEDDVLIAEIQSISAFFNPDPFIDYGIAAKNFAAAPVAFVFAFFSPYVGGPYNTLDSSHASSVTDSTGISGAPDGAITVTPTPNPLIHTPHIDAVAVPGAALGAGCALVGSPGFSGACNATTLVFVGVATAAAGVFDVSVGFDLSPGDLYTGNGRIELKNVSVPEPTSLTLVGLGVLVLAVIRRRSLS